jgi:hypothetical protein
VIAFLFPVIKRSKGALQRKFSTLLTETGWQSKQSIVLRHPLDRFWKLHHEKLSDVRCMSAAHRDLDGLSLLESIESINILEVAELGLEAGKILNDIGTVLQLILGEGAKVTPPEMKAGSSLA